MKNTKEIQLPILQKVETLDYVTPEKASILNKIGISRVIDLLLYQPISVIERKLCNKVQDLEVKKICIIQAKVVQHIKNKRTLEIVCKDKADSLFSIFYFNYYNKYITNYYNIDTEIKIAGTADIFNNKMCIVHPDKVYKNPNIEVPILEVKYKKHHSCTSSFFNKAIGEALLFLEKTNLSMIYDEYYPTDLLFDERISLKEALYNIHNPKSKEDISKNGKYIKKLALGELLAFHLGILLQREKVKQIPSVTIKRDSELAEKYKQLLSFDLTQDQMQALDKILEMFQNNTQDTLLLQGDVGSGKTVVCILASLYTISNGYKVAFMAPTEILATQHYENFIDYANKMNINIALLKGKDKTRHKNLIISKLKNREIDIIFGTHALFQNKIKIPNLGLCIIDEQHRFGVNQRMALSEKGESPKVLLTTATPIPRSLALSLYGDIESILIKEKPLNRKDIITILKNIENIEEVFISVNRLLINKEKCFWICPLIEDIDNNSSVIIRHKYLQDKFAKYKNKIYLLHGKLSADEKQKVISDFTNTKEGGVLVSTTVIEVGVDIPSCNVIIIENSEKFGLAQLHQLRGRVGRSSKQGYCILLYGSKVSKTAKEKMKIIRSSNDGFYLAEQDLKIRGAGNIISTKQSGHDYFKVFSLENHFNYTVDAMSHAKELYSSINDTNSIYSSILNFLSIYNIDFERDYIKRG